MIALALEFPVIGTCPTCRTDVYDDELGGLCDVCGWALREGNSIEEARLEVEDMAAWGTPIGARMAGEKCSCGVVDHVLVRGPKRRGRGGGELTGVVHFDVRHEPPCPLAPPDFDWPEVDEAARERIFGYRGREHHIARLVTALRAELHDREVLDV